MIFTYYMAEHRHYWGRTVIGNSELWSKAISGLSYILWNDWGHW